MILVFRTKKLGISGTKVGKRLGLSRSTASPAGAGFKEVNNWFSARFKHQLSLYDTRNAWARWMGVVQGMSIMTIS